MRSEDKWYANDIIGVTKISVDNQHAIHHLTVQTCYTPRLDKDKGITKQQLLAEICRDNQQLRRGQSRLNTQPEISDVAKWRSARAD